MLKRDYLFAKKAARTAYLQALKDAQSGGNGDDNQSVPDHQHGYGGEVLRKDG